MNALVTLAAVVVLPPPPAPTNNPAIDTARVVGIVLVSLGLIALVTLLLRPLVARRSARPAEPVAEPALSDEPIEAAVDPTIDRGLIRFPAPLSSDTAPGWQVNDPAVADRFQQVVGDHDRRRKLGDRNPSRPLGHGYGGRDRRPRETTRSYLPRHASQPIGTVIPIYDHPAAQPPAARATGTSKWSVAPPIERQDRVWAEPQPAMRPSESVPSNGTRRPLPTEQEVRDLASAGAADPSEPQPTPAISKWTLVDDWEAIDPSATSEGTTATPDMPAAAEPEPAAAPADLVVSEEPVWIDAEPSTEPELATDAEAEMESRIADEPATDPGDHADELIAEENPDAPISLRQTEQLVLAPGLRIVIADEPDEAAETPLAADDQDEITESPAPADEPGAIVTPTDGSGDEIDPETLAGITNTIRELIFCANTGEVERGLALYSAEHLVRFMDSTGLNEEEFREAFSVAHPRPPETWEQVAGLRDLARLPDGRIEVTASYVDPRGEPSDGLERYRLVLDPEHNHWLIDDIDQLPGDA